MVPSGLFVKRLKSVMLLHNHNKTDVFSAGTEFLKLTKKRNFHI